MVDLVPPNGEFVAVAWLRRETGATTIGTTLPRDLESWREEGFVQVQAIPTIADVDVPEHRGTMLQLDGWGHASRGDASSVKPQWGLAASALEVAIRALDNAQPFGATLDLPAPYASARVLSAYAVTEPNRVTDDPSGFARFTVDVVLDWAVAP